MGFNGGKIQFNMPDIAWAGAYVLLDWMKGCQSWARNNAGGFPDPNKLDSNGYPIAQDGTGIFTVTFPPNTTERSGNYVLKWNGRATFSAIGSATVSGSFDNNDGVSTIGRAVFTPNSSQDQITGVTGNRMVVSVNSIDATLPPNGIVLCHVDDESKVDAGQYFSDKFISILQAGGIGVLRFMGVQGTNGPAPVTWADRTPLTQWSWKAQRIDSSIYAGVTTNSGNAYSVTKTGFSLVDKVQIAVKFNATATGQATLSVNGGTAININDAEGSSNTDPGLNQLPTINRTATLVYDADLNCYVKWGGDIAFGDVCGSSFASVPIEICVTLCNQIGAHPWFCIPQMALDPLTDFTTQLATYCKNNLAIGLIPRFECTNEVWNYAFPYLSTVYGDNKANAHWGTSGDHNNWYGKVLSLMGQAVSAVYGNDRTKYQVVCGVQTVLGLFPSSMDDRLKSTKYVNVNGGSAAKNWTTYVACANYWHSVYQDSQETAYANAYASSPSMTILNNYVNDNSDSSEQFTLPKLSLLYQGWKAWGAGLGVNGLTGYEGGWSPDYTGNATLDTLRGAAKAATDMQAATFRNLNNFIADGGEFPSFLQLSSTGNVWSVFDYDIYQTPSTQWDAILAFNEPGINETVFASDLVGSSILFARHTSEKTDVILYQGQLYPDDVMLRDTNLIVGAPPTDMSEIVTAFDTSNSSTVNLLDQTEAGIAADAPDSSFSVISTIAETDPVFDATSGGLVSSISDAGIATDAISLSLAVKGDQVESGAGADIASSILLAAAVMVEIGTASDIVNTILAAKGSVAEVGALADLDGSTIFAVASATEVGVASDALVALLLAKSDVAESRSALDIISAAGPLAGSQLEAGAVADVAVASLIDKATIAEASSAAEFLSGMALKRATLADFEFASDLVGAGVILNNLIHEAGSVIELTSVSLVYNILETGALLDVTSGIILGSIPSKVVLSDKSLFNVTVSSVQA